MANKTKKKSEENNEKNSCSLAEFASLVDGQILDDLDPVKYFVDIGNLAMNFLCSGKFIGGGIPGGRITEISGPSSSGKSLWATNALRGTQAINGIAIYLDCENALSKEFAMIVSHVDATKIIKCRPATLEAAFGKIYNIISKARERYDLSIPIVFVYDSLSASPCERELRETQLEENYTQADWKRVVGSKEQPGERAKICSKELRKLESLLEKTNCTLLIINQVRNKIGIMYGDPTTTSGGLALQFHAGCRIRTQPSQKIENKRGKIIGVRLKAKNIKNKCSSPFKEAVGINLYFEKGVNPVTGLLELLLVEGRIDTAGKGMYAVAEPYAGGKSVKFKASKDSNIVPIEVLFECPSLIDASSKEEIEDYLGIFADAINQTFSGDDIEKDIKNEAFDDDEEIQSTESTDSDE